MDGINPVTPRIITSAKSVPAEQSVSTAQPAAALPQTAVPPQGMAARPPIDNIASHPETISPNIVGTMAEVAAGSVAKAEEEYEELQLEDEKEEELIENSEQAIIDDMRSTIRTQTQEVAKKVNRSAFKFMFKNTQWLNTDTATDAEQFFTIKVPRVLAEELSKILNDALGLNDSEEAK